MSRRNLHHALTLPVLVAILMCVVLPLPALAQSGQGHGKSQQEKSGYERSREKRDASNDQRDNGRNDGGKHGRGREGEQRQAPDDHHNNGRNAQQSQSLSPQQAAQRARSQYGGQVLKVQPAGHGYQVRLLQEDGRVVTVPIGD
jgi:hypothetical protein